MADHVPDKKTVTSQFHSTLIGTRILKGQNEGRRFRTGKLVEADQRRSTVVKARKRWTENPESLKEKIES